MPKRNIKFNLDFTVKDILQKFSIKQFDNALISISTFLDNKAFNPINNTCKLYVSVGKDVFLQQSNIRVLENLIEIDLDKNVISTGGKALAELELLNSSGVLTSATFMFNVDPKVGEGSTVPGGIEGFIAKHERLIREFKEDQKQQLDNISANLVNLNNSVAVHGEQLAQIENVNNTQNDRLNQVEHKNKVQDVYLNGLFNENKDGRLSVEGEGNSLKLEGSKEGLVTVDKVIGNTLVNIDIGGKFQKYSDTIIFRNGSESYLGLMKPSTVYTLFINYIPQGANRFKYSNCEHSPVSLVQGKSVYTLTTPSEINNNVKNPHIYGATGTVFTEEDANKVQIMLFEGDISVPPIDVFEGLQSTFENKLITQEMVDSEEELAENLGKYKCEVKVRGKNLFDGNFYFKDFDWVNGIVSTNSSDWSISDKVYLDKGQYTISHNNPNYTGTNVNYLYIILLTENGEYIDVDSRLGMDNSKKTFNLDKGRYVRFYIKNPTIVDFQVEKNGTITSYEPYYESTKTVYLNSPFLKGDEIVVKEDGTYHWHKMKLGLDNTDAWELGGWDDSGATYSFKLIVPGNAINANREYPTVDNLNISLNTEGLAPSTSWEEIYLRIAKTKLSNEFTVEALKSYLQQNPIDSFVYELAEPYFEKISDDKLLLETPNNATLSVDSVIPCSNIKATYTGNVPSVYALEETNANQDDLIDVSLMATDEMYMMLEPILEMIPQTMSITERRVSKMVDMYVAMVQRGLKTIEEVPVRYREQVKEILAQLEK